MLAEENAKLDDLFGYFNTMTAPTDAKTPVRGGFTLEEGFTEGNFDYFFGRGITLYIDDGTSAGRTVVYYLDAKGQKVYLNQNGAAGEDLSSDKVFSGDYVDMSGNTNIVMNGGTVASIYGGCFNAGYTNGGQFPLTGDVNITINEGSVTVLGASASGNVLGNVNITIKGGTVSKVVCRPYTSDTKVSGNVNLIISGGNVGNIEGELNGYPVYGTVNGYIASGTVAVGGTNTLDGQFNHLIYKNGSSWIVHGNPSVPSGVTMAINSDETVTVPVGTTVTNNGSIVNSGTMHLKGIVKGNPVDTRSGGIIYRYAAYIENIASVSSVTAEVDGSAQTGFYYEVADNCLWLWLPAGDAKVTVNGATYCGKSVKGEKSKLTAYAGATAITGMPEQIGANKEITLEASATVNGQTPPLDQTFTYEIVSSGTTAEGASVTANGILYAASGGMVRVKVTAADTWSYGSYSQEFPITVTYTPINEELSLQETGIVNRGIELPAVSPKMPVTVMFSGTSSAALQKFPKEC